MHGVRYIIKTMKEKEIKGAKEMRKTNLQKIKEAIKFKVELSERLNNGRISSNDETEIFAMLSGYLLANFMTQEQYEEIFDEVADRYMKENYGEVKGE